MVTHSAHMTKKTMVTGNAAGVGFEVHITSLHVRQTPIEVRQQKRVVKQMLGIQGKEEGQR
jgi:hypothetical protein